MHIARPTHFPLDSEQCAILLDLELSGSVRALATLRGRDISAVNRQLQKIADLAPVLEKREGKWALSSLGRQLNEWTRDSLQKQQQVLMQHVSIRIASTREFAARILAPKLDQLVEVNHRHRVSVVTSERVEDLLIQGKADIAFECGRPDDPSVKFQVVKSEPFYIVAKPDFVSRHSVNSFSDLLHTPYLWYMRMGAPRLLRLSSELPWVLATFDDIASARSACIAGIGWTILPAYCVRQEIKEGQLTRITGPKLPEEKFGVWWRRGGKSLDSWVKKASEWLKNQDLA